MRRGRLLPDRGGAHLSRELLGKRQDVGRGESGAALVSLHMVAKAVNANERPHARHVADAEHINPEEQLVPEPRDVGRVVGLAVV
eukprot:8211577-Heterocapsa_arctica.AAC.1